MAKNPRSQSSPQSDNAASRAPGCTIKREASFVRVSGDDAIVNSNKRDVEISIIASSPHPIFQGEAVDETESQEIEFEKALVEVARVKLPGIQAFGMAFQIIERALAEGRVKMPLFRKNIELLLETYDKNESSDDLGQS